MTNHDALREGLHALLDDELPAAERARLGRHLAACGACRQELADLRALKKRAAQLPEEVAPSRDLWPAIVARIVAGGAAGDPGTAATLGLAITPRAAVTTASAATPGAALAPGAAATPGVAATPAAAAAPARPGRRVVRHFAWAGGLAAAAGLALILLARAPGPRIEQAGSPGAVVGPTGTEAMVQAGLRDLEVANRAAEANYASALQMADGALPPAGAGVVRAGLSAIDRAIADTRAALAAAPLDPDLLRLLTTDYRSRIALLERAARLWRRL